LTNQYRILIIDDDESIREALATLLEIEGYIVDCAKDGKEALEKTNSYYYNLAIVDWRLPDIEGTVLIKKIKDTIPKMIKVMLTGFPSTNNAIDACNNNADAFILKPVDSTSLISKIEELLKMQQKELKYSEMRIADFILSRTSNLKSMPITQNVSELV
jgi:UDP-3-O-[3-hydroxymyristoyl] N-acetylglucosamine deacetylase